MPRKYTIITPQIVSKVRKYLDDERGFSKAEVARLVGISDHSIQRIVQGYYDQPVEKSEATQPIDLEPCGNKHITEIPFEKLEYLMKCEMFIEEMLNITILSDKNKNELYFPRHSMHLMCERYFPDKTQERIQELTTDTNA